MNTSLPIATEKTSLVLSCGTFESTRNQYDNGLSSQKTDLQTARVLLYTSHLFAQASEGSWQFGLVLFLSAICDNKSLILVSTYGLTSSLTGFLFGGIAGKFVDSTERLRLTQIFIWTENCSVIFATVCCYFLLSRETYNLSNERMILDATTVVLLFGVHILGSIANVLDRGFSVAIERDWVVVMSKMAANSFISCSNSVPPKESFRSKGTSASELASSIEKGQEAIIEKEWLAQTNVTMRQIDLACKVAAPSLTGFILVLFGDTENDLRIACLFVGVINVLALLVEYECTKRIYRLVPDLSNKKLKASENASNNTNSDELLDDSSLSRLSFSFYETDATRKSKVAVVFRQCFDVIPVPCEWRLYFSQRVAPAGFALALLYLNTLSFGAMMTSYLVWRNMRLDAVGFWRGISSVVGLLGTLAYHKSVSVISLESTGQWSIMAQFTCLLLCYASLWVPNNNKTSLAMLICGTCCSRVGLWVFDLSVTQLMQQYVPEDVRGSIGGVQDSLQAFFTLLTFAMGIVVSNPRDFHYFIEVGCSSVGLAAVCFTIGVYMRQINSKNPIG